MKKKFINQGVVAAIVMLGIAVVLPSAAQALPEQAENAQTTVEERKAAAQERVEAAKTRLADAKLKACQNRQESITSIMGRIGDRGQKQIDLFSTIAERTQTFYTEKGKTLANYDELVSNVEAKKAAAQTTVDTVKSTSTEFDCTGENPRGVASTFKESLKAQITALKDYKTSVKDLIVGVKSVQSTTVPTEGEEAN